MSKAFTRESDDLPDRPVLPRQRPLLPPGAKNYLTPEGARRLGEELERLVQVERPQVAASPVDSDSKRQLQVLDERIYHLQQSLESAVVVPAPAVPEDRIRFGASVLVREPNGGDMDLNYGIWVARVCESKVPITGASNDNSAIQNQIQIHHPERKNL